MPTITVPETIFRRLLEKRGIVLNRAEILEKLPLIGVDIGGWTEEGLEIEVFPDRPDMLSPETLVRVIAPFLYGEKISPHLKIKDATTAITVDEELSQIRPVILAAIIRNVNLGSNEEERDHFVKSMMDHQEKLHHALGRGRKRASIGVHDLAYLKPPFRTIAAPKTYSFVPLGENNPMTIDEILSKHPKGIDYAHLLEGMSHVPLILDSEEQVLSFPPIINGRITTISTTTRDVLIDVTGWDTRACTASLLLMCLQFLEHGGQIEAVEVLGAGRDTVATPSAEATTWKIDPLAISNLLGIDLGAEEIAVALERMGGVLEQETSAGNLSARMPAWRADLLHPIDIVEDVAIGHGYEKIGNADPRTPITGSELPIQVFDRRIRLSLQGAGFSQVQSLSLSSENIEFDALEWAPLGSVTKIENEISKDHTILRQRITPGLLGLLATNRHNDLPQRIYESGTVVIDGRNQRRMGWSACERTSGFARSRGLVQRLLLDLGISVKSVDITPCNAGPWINGRGASVEINGTNVGFFGEISPLIAESFDLHAPIHSGEIDLEALSRIVKDPITGNVLLS